MPSSGTDMYNCIGGDDVEVDDEKHIACDTTAHICADEMKSK